MAILKIKIRNIIESQQAIQKLLPQKPTPRLAYWLGKSIRVIMDELEDFEKARKSLIERLDLKLDGETNSYDTKPHQEEWESGFKELLDTDIEVNLRKFTLEEIEEGELEISVEDMMVLDWLIAPVPENPPGPETPS